MKITIEIDSGTTTDKYSEIFNEIAQTECSLGGRAQPIEHIGVRRVDDGHGSWQLVLTITFMIPFCEHDKRKWKVDKYLDTRIPGCGLKKIITEETRSFTEARISEAKDNLTDLKSYRIPN